MTLRLQCAFLVCEALMCCACAAAGSGGTVLGARASRPLSGHPLGALGINGGRDARAPKTVPLDAPALAQTPPMGWNDWYRYECKVNDAVVQANADALVSSGMKAAGYVYVNLDDCWQGKRDDQGLIRSNKRFPDMKALGDYIHQKGLKFGIY